MASFQKTVIIVESESVAFKSLEKILTPAGFRVVQYRNQETLRKFVTPKGNPCILIIGDGQGVAFLKALQAAHLNLPSIFVHSGSTIAEAVQAIQSGAEDYIPKPFSPEALVASVNRAMGKAIDRANVPRHKKELQRRAAALTPREREIINLVLAGMLNKQIAETLNLALVTVKVHRGRLMRKLGARTAAELAHIVRDIGLGPTNHAPHPGKKPARNQSSPA